MEKVKDGLEAYSKKKKKSYHPTRFGLKSCIS